MPTRVDFLHNEESFLDRFEKNAARLAAVYNPIDIKIYEISNYVKRRLDETPQIKKKIRRDVPEEKQTAIFKQMPRNQVLLIEVFSPHFLGYRKTKVVLAGVAFSPIDELLAQEESSRQTCLQDIEYLKKTLVVNRQVFYYILIYSPTGFTADARTSLTGQNYIIGLADRFQDRYRVFVPAESRTFTRGFFDLMIPQEKTGLVREILNDHKFELLMDSFTEDLAHDLTYLDEDDLKVVFQNIRRSEKFIEYDTLSKPARLIRDYNIQLPLDEHRQDPARFKELLIYDEERFNCLLSDLQVLAQKQEELLNKGAQMPESERKVLAYLIKGVRQRIQEGESRVIIYEKRIKLLREYVNLLENIADLSQKLPDEKQIEDAYVQASVLYDKLVELSNLASFKEAPILEMGIREEVIQTKEERPKEPQIPSTNSEQIQQKQDLPSQSENLLETE